MTKADAIAAYQTATYREWVRQGRPPLYARARALGATDQELRTRHQKEGEAHDERPD